MAETPEETPETIAEEVENAATSGGDTTGTEEAATTATADAPHAPAPKGTRQERLEQRRSARRKPRGPLTPEERNAERIERRRATATQRRAYRARAKVKRAEARKDSPPAEPPHAPEHGPGRARTRQGVVVSDSGEKTITVRIEVVGRHKRYHKILRSTIKLHAHDERNDAHPGDTVRVVECRPMSRTKRWRLVEVVERAK